MPKFTVELAYFALNMGVIYFAVKLFIAELEKLRESMERRSEFDQKRHEQIERLLERQSAIINDNTKLIKPLAVEQWYKVTDQVIAELKRNDPDGTLTCEQLREIGDRIRCLELANPNTVPTAK